VDEVSERRITIDNLFQGGWGKRGWEKFQGSWGKRDSDLDLDGSSQDDDTMAEVLAEANDTEDSKRAWSSLRGGWGKRGADWANFRGQFSKHCVSFHYEPYFY
jgi:hypothetical protein